MVVRSSVILGRLTTISKAPAFVGNADDNYHSLSVDLKSSFQQFCYFVSEVLKLPVSTTWRQPNIIRCTPSETSNLAAAMSDDHNGVSGPSTSTLNHLTPSTADESLESESMTKRTDLKNDDDAEFPILESERPTPLHKTGLGRRIYKASPPRVKKALLYIRGPSSPVALPSLRPWLDTPTSFRGYAIHPSIESKVLALTRPLQRHWILILFGVAWIIAFSFLVRAQWYMVPADSFAGCTASFWSPQDGCGMDGQYCLPFQSDQPVEVRCPAACDAVQLLNIRAVGEQEVIYQPLLVGGGDELKTYRGDSWICPAAIQA